MANQPHIDAARKRAFALQVVRDLRDAGYQSLWAGGCVRDLLLGLAPSDYDVATDARPEEVMRRFRRTVPVGLSFGVVRVLGPREAGEVEVATFRSDGAYVDGRRPESVIFGSPELDAQRRDFTINGMFLDPIDDRILDYVGGRGDLDGRILRAIGDPHARFSEDKLRLIRAIRFAARFELTIVPETSDAIRAMAAEISVVAAERVAQELRRMLAHPSRAKGVELFKEYGLLSHILGEGSPLSSPPETSWRRALSVLSELPNEAELPLALAALLANVPRAPQAAEQLGRRLRLSNAERERVVWLLDRWPELANFSQGPASSRKRLLAEAGARELINLGLALSKVGLVEASEAEYAAHYLQAQPEGPFHPTPLIRGDHLRGLGLPPGPAYKEWIERAYNAQLDGHFDTLETARDWLRGAVRTALQETDEATRVLETPAEEPRVPTTPSRSDQDPVG